MKIAIVGVTGLVGEKISWLLDKRNFSIQEYIRNFKCYIPIIA